MALRYRLAPDPGVNFEEAMAACSFVLSTAGHQVIAESIALNKPILVIPQRGQWEQQLNAEMVEKTGKGKSTTVPGLRVAIQEFRHNLERYRSNRVPSGFMTSDDRKSILRKIDAFLQECGRRTISRASRLQSQQRSSRPPSRVSLTLGAD